MCVCVCVCKTFSLFVKREKKYFKVSRSTKWFVFFKDLFIAFLHSYMFPAYCFRQGTMWHKAMWMGYSMRLELISVWMVLSFVCVYIEATPPFPFLRVCIFVCFTHNWSLIVDMFSAIEQFLARPLTVTQIAKNITTKKVDTTLSILGSISSQHNTFYST